MFKNLIPIYRKNMVSTTINNKYLSSKIPLIEHYQTTWPHPRPSAKIIAELPKRTVPEKNLHFTMKATLDHGMSIFYPHLNMHPADLKVTMAVSIDEIGLNDVEKKVFIEMVSTRFNTGRRQVKLVTNRFPNRLENKKYLVYLLEKLIAESKRLVALDLTKVV